jgi:hypothetical protein
MRYVDNAVPISTPDARESIPIIRPYHYPF